jgi:predicted Zn-ribbon and HTH transcriptional regulator
MPRGAPQGATPVRSQIEKKPCELADIFAEHGEAFHRDHPLPGRHLKVMRRIIACRTKALGGHRHRCDDCGFERSVYHSCRDRHCPKCQVQAKEAWREARQLDLLPVPYFHQVFTLPHEFNTWLLACEENQRVLLKLLFDCVAQTLLEFGRGELGGQVGFTSVLHTWDQQLQPHFHLHVLIASGALAQDKPQSGEPTKTASRWIAGGAKFLFPVRALSTKFRGKFLAYFEALLRAGKLRLPAEYAEGTKHPRAMLRRVRKKPWVIYSKAPFAGPAKLLDYLSRYTHRVAISNDRILACEHGQVTFAYRDRTDGDRKKTQTIPVNQFIGRFLRHVLPGKFMRIRHYGFLSNNQRKAKLETIRSLIGARAPQPQPTLSAAQWLEAVLGIDPLQCPCCGSRLQDDELPRRALRDPLRPRPRQPTISTDHASSRAPPRAITS